MYDRRSVANFRRKEDQIFKPLHSRGIKIRRTKRSVFLHFCSYTCWFVGWCFSLCVRDLLTKRKMIQA